MACQAVNVLVPLLKEEVAHYSAKTLLILAYLIDEENNHLIMADEGKPYHYVLITICTIHSNYPERGRTLIQNGQGCSSEF